MTFFHARGRDAAVRHVLRHIGDARALRSNALVAAFFIQQTDRAALRRIRAIVQSVIDSLERDAAQNRREADSLRRQAAILSRCDLAGEPHQPVIDDLGLERRQFYRERRRVRARIEAALREASPAAYRQVTALDRYALSIAHARSLHGSGLHAQAAEIAGELSRESNDPHRRLESGGLLIEVLMELGDVRRANDVLQELRNTDSAARELEAKLQWCKALVEERSGNFGEAVAPLRATVASLEKLEIQRSPDGDELLARAYASLALCRQFDGSNEESARLWSMARDFLDDHPWLSPQITAQILCHLGAAQLLVSGDAELAESSLLRALAIAEHNSLPREAGDVAIGLGSLYLRQGDRRKALESARWGLELSRKTRGPTEYAWRSLNVATVALAAGSPDIAARLARDAVTLHNPQRLLTGLANAIESSALFAVGHRHSAREAAGEAVAVLRTAGNSRVLGSALRVSAEVNYALELFDEARTAIEESVELLSRYGYRGGQARAVESRAKICGNSRRQGRVSSMLVSRR